MVTANNNTLSTIIQQDLLDEKSAAQFFVVVPGTLSVWRCTGRYKIPFIKVGRLVRYRMSDLDAWLKSRTHTNGVTG